MVVAGGLRTSPLTSPNLRYPTPKTKPKYLENVMSKIVELNLAETKAIVGGLSLNASVVVAKIPTGSVNIPVSLPMSGQSAPSAPTKRF